MNNVCLFGRIANELELKSTTSGKSICNFNLAINKYNSDDANFIPCRVWDKVAENLTRYKKKGDQIVIVGSIETSDYEKDGEKRKYVYVNVNQIHYVATANQNNNNTENKEIEKVAEDVFETNNVELEDDEVNISFDDLPFDMGA
jgi:single-strand DNA-binding protein